LGPPLPSTAAQINGAKPVDLEHKLRLDESARSSRERSLSNPTEPQRSSQRKEIRLVRSGQRTFEKEKQRYNSLGLPLSQDSRVDDRSMSILGLKSPPSAAGNAIKTASKQLQPIQTQKASFFHADESNQTSLQVSKRKYIHEGKTFEPTGTTMALSRRVRKPPTLEDAQRTRRIRQLGACEDHRKKKKRVCI
jgi:hypothetical protein